MTTPTPPSGAMTLRINVTREDIAQGDVESVSLCPIGLAFARAVGHPDVSVDRQYMIDKRSGMRACERRSGVGDIIVESTPKVAVEFQTALMAGRKVRPFSFDARMELP